MSKRSRRYRVANATKGTILATAAEKPGMGRRGIGLMGRKGLPDGGGLILLPCNSVVCFFMRFAIDVVFVTKDDEVCYLRSQMAPWRTSRMVRHSRYVVELPAGKIEATGTELGDTLQIERTL
jgi:uncharacterized protein